MSATLEHFVLTRFSATSARGQPPPEDDWLWYRLGFFVDACHPSVLAQSDRDFRWLVWFDDRCSDGFRAEVETLAAGAFEPVWGHEPFFAAVAGVVTSRSAAPVLATTRLDSDDAIAADFVERVHAEAVEVTSGRMDRLVVNFPHGLQVDRSGAVYRYRQPSSHFATMVERRHDGPPVTVFVGPHPLLRRHAAVREVQSPPMWVEVVHDGNLLNGVSGRRVHPDVLADRFDLPLGFRAGVSRRDLVREQVVTAVRQSVARATGPFLLVQSGRALLDRVVGTRTKPRRADVFASWTRAGRWRRRVLS